MRRTLRPVNVKILFACLILFGAMGCACQSRPAPPPSRSDLLNYGKPLAHLLKRSRVNGDAVALYIEKSRLRLTVRVHGRAIKSYPVVLGGNPVDDKRYEGDSCTPEGTFRIRARYPHKSWSKFLWLNYPNADSWRKFQAAKRRGEINPQATVGSEIGIHGVPTGYDALVERRSNWTLGCISLKTADINEIYSVVKVGTRVKIVP